jgi:ABC-type glutathione transport system ATPase component
VSHQRRTTLLSVSDLNVSYRTRNDVVAAVRGLDLELHRGEAMALVGESASGKTTVALSLLRILPTNTTFSGEMTYDGVSLSKMSERDLRRVRGDEIAIIFQDAQSALTPPLTVGDQISELFTAHRPMSKLEAAAATVETLSRVLPDAAYVAKSYPFQLSGGMAQRALSRWRWRSIPRS